MKDSHFTRRELLKIGATGALALGLPACGDMGTSGGSELPALIRPSGIEDDDWVDVRAQFLINPGVAYLNNASLGVPPRQVVDAVADGYRSISEDPHAGKVTLQTRIAEVVEPRLAALLGVQPDEITLTRNASEALHLQTVGLVLRPGDEVIITSQEHPAGRAPWLFRAARDGVHLKEVFIPSPLPPDADIVGRIESAITERTRAIAFCHVTRGGHLYPVRTLCEMARARGLASLVDGAQAVGQFPIDLGELGCDAYSASLHKWLFGPVGTGFMYVRASARDRIVSAFTADGNEENPGFTPPGTVAFPVRAGLAASLDFVNTLGLDLVSRRCRYLSDYLKERLAVSPKVRLLSGERGQSAPGSTIFEVDGVDALQAVDDIRQKASSHIDEHQRDGHNAIRISTHIYNTREHIDRVVAALTRD